MKEKGKDKGEGDGGKRKSGRRGKRRRDIFFYFDEFTDTTIPLQKNEATSVFLPISASPAWEKDRGKQGRSLAHLQNRNMTPQRPKY